MTATAFNTANEFAKFVTVFNAIRWIRSPWNNVQEETILKCFQRASFASPENDLQEQEDSTGESDLVNALPEALQFEVASKDDILENEQEVEEEEVDQQPPNRPPSYSEALHVHSLMQFVQTNLPHLQPTLINIYSEIERNWATANIQKKKHTTLHQFFTTPK